MISVGFRRLMTGILFVCLSTAAGSASGTRASGSAPASAPGPANSGGSFSPDGLIKVWIDLQDKGPRVRALPGSRVYEDAPLHAPYVEALTRAGAKVLAGLKWQNRVSVLAPASALPTLRALPWVRDVRVFSSKLPEPVPPPWSGPQPFLAKQAGSRGPYGATWSLMDSLRITRLHRWMASRGMAPGRGLRIAVIDSDFKLGHRAFHDMLAGDRIKDSWDFVEGRAGGVNSDTGGSHGAQCLSLIGSNMPDTIVGVAPYADFLLYRAEDVSQERYVEEDYVAAAIERAVDSGAKVISISLGYRDGFTDGSPDYPYAWLDGRTRPSSLAAVGAARRDVLVVTAVGNVDPAHAPYTPTLGAPADADSILAVGMVDLARAHCPYSCAGPSADGRIKPDIASMGPVPDCNVWVAHTYSTGRVYYGAGTSFGAPVIAGIAALVRQIRPGLKAEEARQAILSSGHRAARPDSLVGYGLADAWAAVHGSGAVPPREDGRRTVVYHPGGRFPLSVAWETGASAREVTVMDAAGRSFPVTARNSGARLLLEPDRDLRTGVYFVRVKPTGR